MTRGTTGKGVALLLDGVRKQLEASKASFDVGYVLVPLARGYPDLAVDLEEWLCVSGEHALDERARWSADEGANPRSKLGRGVLGDVWALVW